MKKIFYLLLISICISLGAHAQSDWVKYQVGDRISVKFPTTAKKLAVGNNDVYIGKDSVGYTAVVVDFVTTAGMDSVALAPVKDLPEFAAQLRAGMGSTMPGFTLGDVAIGKWKGHTVYDMVGTGTQRKEKMVIHMVLVGSRMCTLSVIVPDSVGPTKDPENYFATLELGN